MCIRDRTGATYFPINADEPDAFDYNLDFGRDGSLLTADIYRASDHDPIIVGLDLNSEPDLNVVMGTNGRDILVGTDADDLIVGNGGRNDFLTGGAGADQFYFDDAQMNGMRDHSRITDYEVGVDSIVLDDALTVVEIRQAGEMVIVHLADTGRPNDAILIRGDGVTVDNITIVHDSYDDLLMA